MGVTCDQYLIFTSHNPKLLKKMKKFCEKKFSKEKDLENYLDCIQGVGGGMNGHYSFVIYPTGWNGGWDSYSHILDSIKEKISSINWKSAKFNKDHYVAINKQKCSSKSEIYMKILSNTDWGITYEDDRENELRQEGINPELKWANDLGRSVTRFSDEEMPKKKNRK